MNTHPFLDEIIENFRFIIIEVTKQVEATEKVLEKPSENLVERINARDDYIDNLKSTIENKCFSRMIAEASSLDQRGLDKLRALNIISNNMERIADYAVNVVGQMQYFTDYSFINRYDYKSFIREIIAALRQVETAMLRNDFSLALCICRAEFTLDKLYKIQFDKIMEEFRGGDENPENLITTVFIFRYLERMGDSLQNIGEAIVFSIIGEKFKIRQYEALKETMAATGVELDPGEMAIRGIWGTRSGCRIGTLEGADRDKAANDVLFKEGKKRKIELEMKNIRRWDGILPGLPPRVVGYQEYGEDAALLLEFLNGCTFQDVILSATEEIIENAVYLFKETLNIVWSETYVRRPACVGFMEQLKTRLDDVFKVHENFLSPAQGICDFRIPSLSSKITQTAEIEGELSAPFSVYIHGDFNINNVLYHHKNQRINFIDLHRSKDTDYVQDISVFLISNFRIPVEEEIIRARLNYVIEDMLKFVREFASDNDDETFESRLALGLSRSFVTSTRFELHEPFAQAMFYRGVYLLDKILEHRGRPWKDFVLPDSVLRY